jgi:catechol 2,3-dioxygenase-like lactoylglutathione lyase family enzyme
MFLSEVRKEATMLDHVFLTVSDMKRSISFYEAPLAPLGINERIDFDRKNGPPGHPDLKIFGANGHHLGGDVRQFTFLPGFHLLPHRFEVALHPIHAD